MVPDGYQVWYNCGPEPAKSLGVGPRVIIPSLNNILSAFSLPPLVGLVVYWCEYQMNMAEQVKGGIVPLSLSVVLFQTFNLTLVNLVCLRTKYPCQSLAGFLGHIVVQVHTFPFW